MYSPFEYLTVVTDVSQVAGEALGETTATETMEQSEVIAKSFELMGKGLLGIFVTITIIMICVFILMHISKGENAGKTAEKTDK
ncbi:MAG: hypothetical protein IKX10_07620 [Lachnospiraceae bacterium]|nr:hypothetical protein [Lachnospiraceae bacterium]